MQSGASASLAGTGFTTGSTAGSFIAGTLSTNGLSLRVPQYITTVPVNSVVFVSSVGNVTFSSSVGGSTTSIYAFGGAGTGGGIAARITGNTSGTTALISSGTLTLGGSNGITLSQSGNRIDIFGQTGNVYYTNGSNVTWGSSVSGGNTSIMLTAGTAGAADGYNILAAGGSTASSTGTILFSNANGLSFGFQSTTRITASHNAYTGTGQFSASFLNTGEAHIRALGITASSNKFTSGSVMLSGINLTVNTSENGASQYLQISGPQIGYLFFSNNGTHSWGSSNVGVSTSIWLI